MALFLDGIETAEHTIVVALGVDADGHKHPLGLWEGSTENRLVCQALLANLVDRGLDPERPRLVVIDGGKGVRAAVRATLGDRAMIQRCRQHKRRNVLDHLPEEQRTFIGRKLDRAWQETDPSAPSRSSWCCRQPPRGPRRDVDGDPHHSQPEPAPDLQIDQPDRVMISVARTVTGNVKRWRNGEMILRWTAAGVLEAEKQFRRVNSYRDLQLLRLALEAILKPSTAGVGTVA